ncbi:TetR/AcrR family transcriptional regulator [Microterricola pindariensis]|uniref:Transcriptional regulator n=1 Tax=Microterricola pindariensis TaxID=478010 RepID=A0ABX5ASN5_9MICO|nr:TetR/AcrR family transcriptional regulator C-terminal ligand-binding domain-containing protein [Microterricola pindariensis]PPL14432.1 transcriptional regulator [Microterricola pindariensis]
MTLPTAPDAGAAVRRGPGRPRDEELDGQILAAVLALIDAEQEVTVARVVAGSGVSRAALYRRWPSMTTLIAAALDVGRSVPAEIPTDGDGAGALREAVFAALLGDPSFGGNSQFTETRFRQRIRLVMADRQLQKAYWSSHVARRRGPMERAFLVGRERGILRPDLDVEASFDAIAGACYYQLIVRGDSFDDPATRSRVRAALDIVWRGMLA